MEKTLKTIAMYLPQYHQIKENDEWWGEGYTEWTAVKAAEPLFEGHMQPILPKDGYYYDLSKKETMQKQAEWMHEYGVDGLCFYHYYFKDGMKLLEKPAENLLQWKDIDMPFCFCWANASWARSWSKIKFASSWNIKLVEKSSDNKDNGILAEQKYGREREWKKHFDYLLPFFKDDRYLKLNGAPIFIIYKPDDIHNLYQMLDCWKKLAVENGFQNIYIIGMNVEKKIMGIDAVILHAPATFFGKTRLDYKGDKQIHTYVYRELCEKIIESKIIDNCKTYFEGFVNYDDTPRRGDKGIVVTGGNEGGFGDLMYQLFRKSLTFENEYIFINAWNEWGEGMYLEPDEQHGFGYLRALKNAKEKALSEDIDENLKNRWLPKKQTVLEKELSKRLDKQMVIARCLDDWMFLKEKGVNVADYLKRYNYNKVAIYGIGILGQHLLNDLYNSDVIVSYVIDRRSNINSHGYKVKSPDEEYEPVDAIVVTAMTDFNDIYNVIRRKIQCPILSIQELVQEV